MDLQKNPTLFKNNSFTAYILGVICLNKVRLLKYLEINGQM
jgi:hypothetical protein